MGVNEYLKVGSRIKELRKSKGISQRAFATKLGIPFSTYSNYENDNREPSMDTLQRIADALGVHMSYLLGTGVKAIITKDHVFVEGSPEYEAAGLYDSIAMSNDMVDTFNSLSQRERNLVMNFIKLLKSETQSTDGDAQ